jgi:hypothetical protein
MVRTISLTFTAAPLAALTQPWVGGMSVAGRLQDALKEDQRAFVAMTCYSRHL